MFLASLLVGVAALACIQLNCPVSGSVSGIFYDGGLDQTLIQEFVSKRERREMQEEILSLLGLHRRPRPSLQGVETSAPKFMIDVYRSLIDEDGDLKLHVDPELEVFNISREDVTSMDESDLIMSFMNHGHHLSHARRTRHRHVWFDTSEVPLDEMVTSAELRLKKEQLEDSDLPNTDYVVSVYQVRHNLHKEELTMELVDSRNTTLGSEGWLPFNVTKAADEWRTFPESNLGLYITVSATGYGHDLDPDDIGIIGIRDTKSDQPFMVAFFKSPSRRDLKQRETRGAKNRRRNTQQYSDMNSWDPARDFKTGFSRRSCQKRTLYVSFRALGWQDWIIAPDGYAAFYCSGECSFPLNAHMNATNHAIVQTLVHLMNPYVVPKPCCAPTKLSAISVLYFDDNSNVILKKYRNMVVKSCGCH